MRDKLNCPNCGAPISNTNCPYCGAVFYDFAEIDAEKPTYIRIRWHGNQLIFFRARAVNVDISTRAEAIYAESFSGTNLACIPSYSATVNVEFDVYPDDDGVLFITQNPKREWK